MTIKFMTFDEQDALVAPHKQNLAVITELNRLGIKYLCTPSGTPIAIKVSSDAAVKTKSPETAQEDAAALAKAKMQAQALSKEKIRAQKIKAHMDANARAHKEAVARKAMFKKMKAKSNVKQVHG